MQKAKEDLLIAQVQRKNMHTQSTFKHMSKYGSNIELIRFKNKSSIYKKMFVLKYIKLYDK